MSIQKYRGLLWAINQLVKNMDKGWVKLHRKIDDNTLLSTNNAAYVMFNKLLTNCDRKTGIYVTGRNKLAALCNLKPTTAYKTLKRLQKEQLVVLRSNNHFTEIHICNWIKYQDRGNSKVSTDGLKSITKQEVRSKNTTKVVEPKAPHGNVEINTIVKSFEASFGIEQPSSERKAAQWLRQKYGVETITEMFRKVSVAQNADQYCPRTPTITKFHYAIPALQDYFNRQEKTTEGYSWQ